MAASADTRVVPYESFETYYIHSYDRHGRPPVLPLSIHPRNGGSIDNWLICPWGEFVDPVLSTDYVGDGTYSLKMSYHLPLDSSQTNISRVYENPNLDWSGCNAVRFWLKPDGSGRVFKFMILPQYLTARFPSGTPAKEFYFCGITLDGVSPTMVTMPFASFEGPAKLTGGPVNETAFWIMEGRAGVGAIYLDKIEAVRVADDAAVTVTPLATPPRLARGTSLRVNCGSPVAIACGDRWSADSDYYRSGDCATFGDATIAATSQPELYRTQRVGLDGYEVPVENGTWRIRLHVCELDIRTNAPGRRVFGVRVNGVDHGTIDPFALGGAMAVASVREYTTTVHNGSISISCTAIAGMPALAGLEIVPA